MDEYSLLLHSHSEEKARQLLDERYSLSGSQKPFLILHEGANDRSQTNCKRKKHKNSRNQRKSAFSRQLGDFIQKGDRNYAAYMPMHDLWKAYMANILGSSKGDAALQALLSADWHGALISVDTAKNPSLVGVTGILLWESRSQWLIVTASQGFKQIPKRGSVINLISPNNSKYTVVGDRVLCRSSERTTRKFKPHDVAPITPLLWSSFGRTA